MVDRRTVVVWVCLVGSMTMVSALLLALEPNPAPIGNNVALMAVERTPIDPSNVAATRQPVAPDRWRAIVIHHSGQMTGSAASLDAQHRAADLGSLGYHFVIGNGTDSPDGVVEIGSRWLSQEPGVHATGDQAAWYNQHAIGICVIGDGDRNPPTEAQRAALVQLVTGLQRDLTIPAQHVALHSRIAATTSPGRLFPAGWFRLQLWQFPTQ